MRKQIRFKTLALDVFFIAKIFVYMYCCRNLVDHVHMRTSCGQRCIKDAEETYFTFSLVVFGRHNNRCTKLGAPAKSGMPTPHLQL